MPATSRAKTLSEDMGGEGEFCVSEVVSSIRPDSVDTVIAVTLTLRLRR
jgi:hypothetical protein